MRPAEGRTLAILFDGDCAVCTRTAGWIEARDHARTIECVTLQSSGERFPGFDYDAIRAQLHGVNEEGELFVGVDCLREIGRRLPRWRSVAWILAVPGIRGVSEVFYLWFARNRLLFNRVLGKHEQACTDACEIDWDKLAAQAAAEEAEAAK